MKTFEISVKDKIAALTNDAMYVCGNSDYVVNFHFDAEWDAYDTKTARFAYKGTYQDQVFQGTECSVPIIHDAHIIMVGVFAGNLHTTTPACIGAKRSILSGSGVPADPAPDVYAQIMELIQGLGEPDPETIAAAVADYIRQNPIEESDPTVPAWAKAQEKPTYTAAEVGAISQADKQEIAEQAAGLVSIPNKLPNPNALTFTGAVTGSYDGSAPLSVEIPSGGTGGASVEKQWRLLNTVTLTEPVSAIEILTDSDGNPFEISEFAVYAPLGVVASEGSQILIGAIEPGADYWKQIANTTNGFLGTNSKSILIKSDWVGGRYTVCTSGTYDVAGVPLPVGAVRFYRDNMKDIGGVRLATQYTSITINDGTFYLYGR